MNERFGKQYRLLKTDEYSSVFAFKKQKSGSHIQILYSIENNFTHARIGIIVSKKIAKQAIKRNYMKRVIREWFRCNRDLLPNRDYIVRVRTQFTRDNSHLARQQLSQIIGKI